MFKNIKTLEELQAEALQKIEDAKPKVVSMGQARAALIRTGMFDTVNNTIMANDDLELKSDWEYRTEVRRDWPALIALTETLGITKEQLDDLFQLASTL